MISLPGLLLVPLQQSVNMAGGTVVKALQFIVTNMYYHKLVISLLISTVSGANSGSDGQVLSVADANWTLILQGEWMLKFYAPWCPACQQIQPEWENFAKESKALGISVGKVNVTQEPGLSGRFLVTTLPTIFHAKDGLFRRYLASRTVEDLQSYIIEKKWESVEPVPAWKAPSSIVMMGMSGVFQLSVWLRHIHSYLTETLGVPVWGSYAIFALVTLLTGLFLGLMLVLIVDCLCPSKSRYKEVTTVYMKEELSDEGQDGVPTEEKQLSDAEDERESLSDKTSGEDSAGDEASGPEELAVDAIDGLPSDNTADSGMRKRKPQVPESLNLSTGTSR
ncbi:thioredoxin-related transmembrane protein 1-like isoform X2 [Acipenser ruthenus]|uniref:thioredoxin-related transmembrane protein 1-like isoform X2 n=1 Tax=Acipenser ruthenus TaxID=7906 RepID=UPI0027408606|nr:thioredoxin-related transmembrane protein 1-like isoform X2 [Acipenser ruthenus]